MAKKNNSNDERERLIFDGKVTKADRGGIFIVELDNGNIITAHPSGKIQKNLIKIIPGDRVTVELGPYEPTKGRIIMRMKK